MQSERERKGAGDSPNRRLIFLGRKRRPLPLLCGYPVICKQNAAKYWLPRAENTQTRQVTLGDY